MVITGHLRDVVSKEIKWLWRPFIPFSKITMIQGDTGIGKTHVLIKIMADISNGLYPPTMRGDHLLPQVEGEPVKIFYVSVENGIDDTIAPVFDQFGGNRENVLYQDESQGHFVLNGDEIREVVRQTGAKVIVIDPWQQFLDDMKSSNNIGVREMIGDIQNAAEETGAAIIFTGNFTKGGGNEAQRSIGGSELSNTLRCILTVTRSELGPYIRTVRATKMSLPGKEMTPVAVQMVDGDMHFVDYLDLRDALVDAPPELRAENAAFPEVGVSEEPEADTPIVYEKAKSAVDKAADFLKEALLEGPVESGEIKRRAAELGISESSLSRAKKRSHVVYIRNGDGSAFWKIDYAG